MTNIIKCRVLSKRDDEETSGNLIFWYVEFTDVHVHVLSSDVDMLRKLGI